jgi:hypothetical protein
MGQVTSRGNQEDFSRPKGDAARVEHAVYHEIGWRKASRASVDGHGLQFCIDRNGDLTWPDS